MGARISGLSRAEREAERLSVESWGEWIAARLANDPGAARSLMKRHITHCLRVVGTAKKQGPATEKLAERRREIAASKAPTGPR